MLGRLMPVTLQRTLLHIDIVYITMHISGCYGNRSLLSTDYWQKLVAGSSRVASENPSLEGAHTDGHYAVMWMLTIPSYYP